MKSVKNSVNDSIWHSIENSCWNSVSDSVYYSVKESVYDSVRNYVCVSTAATPGKYGAFCSVLVALIILFY